MKLQLLTRECTGEPTPRNYPSSATRKVTAVAAEAMTQAEQGRSGEVVVGTCVQVFWIRPETTRKNWVGIREEGEGWSNVTAMGEGYIAYELEILMLI